MSTTLPWHTLEEGHFHNQSECAFGAEIPLRHRVEGEGHRPLCRVCDRLERADRRVELRGTGSGRSPNSAA